MVMTINKMEDVAQKLFNDAAAICFQCSRRGEPGLAAVPCPANCGALEVLKCARNIVGEIEARNHAIREAQIPRAEIHLWAGAGR